MIELIKKYREYKIGRKNYYMKWKLSFHISRSNHRIYTLLPTIIYVPWYHRRSGDCIFDITWWKYHILVGEFYRKEEKDG